MSRVSDDIIQASFDRAGVDRTLLHCALLRMCPAALKASRSDITRAMRAEWSRDNPTRFTCYFVSEMVYWYCAPFGSQPMSLAVPGDDTLHRFIEWPDGYAVDLTCDQFTDYSALRYDFARRSSFLPVNGGPSKRARELASILWKNPPAVRRHG